MTAQAVALLAACGVVLSGARFDGIWTILILQGSLAAGLSPLLGLPYWWLPMQALFLPAVAFVLGLGIPAPVFLGVFLLLWLVFRSNARDRIPLYLSNRMTRQALGALLDEFPHPRLLDLGSGLGGTLRHLARHKPDGEFRGVESAPLPFWISRLRLLGCSNVRIRLGDLWREDLSQYDVVYAFLSPNPMSAIWAKACAEMRPGSLLVSNTFEIPGVPPSRVLQLNDAGRTRLLIWEPGHKSRRTGPQNK